MLRTMQKARYDAASLGHFGLAAEHYTHFTSPIRRYPDLVVHRMLRESRHGQMTRARREELEEELPEVARHTSEMERRADEAERELLQWKKVRFMADKVGDEYEGYITGVAPFGLFIELVEHYVEGLVHISSMADDYYRFVEQQHMLRGENTKKVYRLGDKVQVQVVRVDMERRQVDLGLVDILEAVRREERPRGPVRSKVTPKREQRRAQRPGRREQAGEEEAVLVSRPLTSGLLFRLRPFLRGVLEVLDALADPAPDFRQAVRPENQDDDREDDQKLWNTEAAHIHLEGSSVPWPGAPERLLNNLGQRLTSAR